MGPDPDVSQWPGQGHRWVTWYTCLWWGRKQSRDWGCEETQADMRIQTHRPKARTGTQNLTAQCSPLNQFNLTLVALKCVYCVNILTMYIELSELYWNCCTLLKALPLCLLGLHVSVIHDLLPQTVTICLFPPEFVLKAFMERES